MIIKTQIDYKQFIKIVKKMQFLNIFPFNLFSSSKDYLTLPE